MGTTKERYGFLTDLRSVYRVGALGAIWILLSKKRRYRRISEVAASITRGGVCLGVSKVIEEFISQVHRQPRYKNKSAEIILHLVRCLSACARLEVRCLVHDLAKAYPGEISRVVEAIRTNIPTKYLDMLELRGTLMKSKSEEAGAREFLHIAMIMLSDPETLYKIRICEQDDWAARELESILAHVRSWLISANKVYKQNLSTAEPTAIDDMLARVKETYRKIQWAKEVPRWESLLEPAHND